MKFGTLQSFAKEPVKDFDNEDIADIDGIEDTGDELDFDMDGLDSGEDDGLDLGGLDMDSEENPVISKLLTLKREIDEILSDMGYTDDSEGSEFDGEGFDFGADGDESGGADDDFEFDFDSDGTDNPEGEEENEEGEFGGEGGDEGFPSEEGMDPEEKDFQGNIRTVAGADLVYKRKTEDGNFEELWIYTVGNDIRKETQIRKAILAGTDIVPSQRESEDGEQRSETTTLGNVQYLKITGIPN